MLDVLREQLISLAAAAATIPPARNGRKTHISTLLRWIQTGAKAPDGSLVRLEGLRIGGRWMTSRQALQRFAERLTPGGPAQPAATQKVGTPAQRGRAAAHAAAQCEAIGV
jgi:hypothetical protein